LREIKNQRAKNEEGENNVLPTQVSIFAVIFIFSAFVIFIV